MMQEALRLPIMAVIMEAREMGDQEEMEEEEMVAEVVE